jgi:hypothetical protein
MSKIFKTTPVQLRNSNGVFWQGTLGQYLRSIDFLADIKPIKSELSHRGYFCFQSGVTLELWIVKPTGSNQFRVTESHDVIYPYAVDKSRRDDSASGWIWSSNAVFRFRPDAVDYIRLSGGSDLTTDKP